MPVKFSIDYNTPTEQWVHMPSVVCVTTMLSEPGRDNISASPLCAAMWLSETSKACGRQHTCIIDNSKLSYRFCCSLMWRWMQVQSPRPFFHHTHHSVVSVHLCDERWLWDESTRAFKDLKVFGWPVFPHQTSSHVRKAKITRMSEESACHGTHPQQTYLPNFHNTINWHQASKQKQWKYTCRGEESL